MSGSDGSRDVTTRLVHDKLEHPEGTKQTDPDGDHIDCKKSYSAVAILKRVGHPAHADDQDSDRPPENWSKRLRSWAQNWRHVLALVFSAFSLALTVILAFATVGLLLANFGLLKATQQAAIASERASFGNRAWLSVQFLEIGEPIGTVERAMGRAANISVKFLLQNHGVTPARIKNLEVLLYAVDEVGTDENDPYIIKIDPDNPEHTQYNNEPQHVWDDSSGRQIKGRNLDMASSFGEIRQELMIPGNGGSSAIMAEFQIVPPDSFFDSKDSQRLDYWLLVDIPYLDVYQIERRTCFFAHVAGQDAFMADHISKERCNYQK